LAVGESLALGRVILWQGDFRGQSLKGSQCILCTATPWIWEKDEQRTRCLGNQVVLQAIGLCGSWFVLGFVDFSSPSMAARTWAWFLQKCSTKSAGHPITIPCCHRSLLWENVRWWVKFSCAYFDFRFSLVIFIYKMFGFSVDFLGSYILGLYMNI